MTLNQLWSYIELTLNLPSQHTINGITNCYKYAADGTKLKVSRGAVTTDYVGNNIHEK